VYLGRYTGGIGMLGWLRTAWNAITRPIRAVASFMREKASTAWKVVKAVCAVVLAGVIIRTSPVLALGLMTVPWARRVRNDYGKIFVSFAVAVIGSILMMNGIVMIADMAVLILAFAMYEMLTRWWDCVQEREQDSDHSEAWVATAVVR
jgi:hypothetical protein